MTPIEAGRELDALVAEQVMGWRRLKTACNDQQKVTVPPDWTDLSIKRWLGHDINELVPPYSTDIAAAWRVLEQPRWRIEIYRQPHMKGLTTVILNDGTNYGRGDADTAPLAICRAALASVTRYAAESAAVSRTDGDNG